MAVFRIHKSKDFTVMSNHHLRNKELSLKAKGLLTLMLSLPDDWDYSILGLAALSKDGKDSVMSALNELSTSGYVVVESNRNSKGQYESVYNVFENPNRENRCGKSESGNPTQYNTNNDSSNSSRINTPTIPTENNNKVLNNNNPLPPNRGLDLSFVRIEYQDLMIQWLDYRRALKKPYKTKRGIEECYHNLIKLSNDDPHTAQQIVEQSIANEWQGLFALKENGSSGYQTKQKRGNGFYTNPYIEAGYDCRDLL